MRFFAEYIQQRGSFLFLSLSLSLSLSLLLNQFHTCTVETQQGSPGIQVLLARRLEERKGIFAGQPSNLSALFFFREEEREMLLLSTLKHIKLPITSKENGFAFGQIF